MPPDDEPLPFEVGPAAEMQKKYGWYAENWRPPKLDPETVPPYLRDLIPFAERWGVPCDVTRHDVAANADPVELAELAKRLEGRHQQINDWLDSIDISQHRAGHHFCVMLVFEMEELDGPGTGPGMTYPDDN